MKPLRPQANLSIPNTNGAYKNHYTHEDIERYERMLNDIGGLLEEERKRTSAAKEDVRLAREELKDTRNELKELSERLKIAKNYSKVSQLNGIEITDKLASLKPEDLDGMKFEDLAKMLYIDSGVTQDSKEAMMALSQLELPFDFAYVIKPTTPKRQSYSPVKDDIRKALLENSELTLDEAVEISYISKGRASNIKEGRQKIRPVLKAMGIKLENPPKETISDKIEKIIKEHPNFTHKEIAEIVYIQTGKTTDIEVAEKRVSAVISKLRFTERLPMRDKSPRIKLLELSQERPGIGIDEAARIVYIQSGLVSDEREAIRKTKSAIKSLKKDNFDVNISIKASPRKTIENEIDELIHTVPEITMEEVAEEIFVKTGRLNDKEKAFEKTKHYVYKMFPYTPKPKAPKTSKQNNPQQEVTLDPIYETLEQERNNFIEELAQRFNITEEAKQYALEISRKIGKPRQRTNNPKKTASEIFWHTKMKFGLDITQREIAQISNVGPPEISNGSKKIAKLIAEV